MPSDRISPLLQDDRFIFADAIHVGVAMQGNLAHHSGRLLCWCMPARVTDKDGDIFYFHRRMNFN